MTVEIPLVNCDDVLLIDDADLELVSSIPTWRRAKSNRTFYARGGSNPYQIYAHRLIAGVPDGIEIDHENHNGLDCRKSNLRIANPGQNHRNVTSHIDGSSNYLGVCWDKSRQKWIAQLMFNGQKKLHKRFSNEIEAAIAYDKVAKEFFGEFANLNFKDRL